MTTIARAQSDSFLLSSKELNGRLTLSEPKARHATVAILGGGPAGLGAAWKLAQRGITDTIVIERNADVGGNAGSFEIDGLNVDYGSHRLHPACHAEILDDLRGMLGPDLLDRPRHGRIRLKGTWLHFPLKPIDLLRRLPLSFSLGVSRDALAKVTATQQTNRSETFSSVLERSLGKTICREFYFPYARKIWGIAPAEISDIQAYRRVSAGSLTKMMRKALAQLPGFKVPGAGRFYYPRNGYGQISQALALAARSSGSDIMTETVIEGLELGSPHRITIRRDGVSQQIEADLVWSTIPITSLARIVKPEVSGEISKAARSIEYRAMILIYLVIAEPQFTAFDAHYFPNGDVPLTRVSEPKNYSASNEPKDRTVLCCELPCAVDDEFWIRSNDELGELARASLERSGLPVRAPIQQVHVRKLTHAYPVYRRGYEKPFQLLDQWVDSLERVLTFGRQGLFAHDNTHHALAMAYAAVDCLEGSGSFDEHKWQRYRSEFAKHTVED